MDTKQMLEALKTPNGLREMFKNAVNKMREDAAAVREAEKEAKKEAQNG